MSDKTGPACTAHPLEIIGILMKQTSHMQLPRFRILHSFQLKAFIYGLHTVISHIQTLEEEKSISSSHFANFMEILSDINSRTMKKCVRAKCAWHVMSDQDNSGCPEENEEILLDSPTCLKVPQCILRWETITWSA